MNINNDPKRLYLTTKLIYECGWSLNDISTIMNLPEDEISNNFGFTIGYNDMKFTQSTWIVYYNPIEQTAAYVFI